MDYRKIEEVLCRAASVLDEEEMKVLVTYLNKDKGWWEYLESRYEK